MKVVITGAGGQLGRELVATAPAGVDVIAATRLDLDITEEDVVRAFVAETTPDAVVNAAAYTDVDGAESEADVAELVNATAVGHLATAADLAGARLVQISTDYVFDGRAGRPYLPTDEPRPISAYGRSKLGGEAAALAHPGAVVLRTSRLYSASGVNFVTKMLELMRTPSELSVVHDQVGSPTSVTSLARLVWRLALDDSHAGILHWTDAGSCSFYEWAVAVHDLASARGLLSGKVVIHSISSDDYPTPAARPAYSVLDCTGTVELTGMPQHPWPDALGTMLDRMAGSHATQ